MIVGIDIGTQSLKAVVLSPEMKIIGEQAIAYQPSFPKAGWAEQDPLLWEEALAPAIHGAMALAKCKAHEVRALGLAGQLDGCVAVDRQGMTMVPLELYFNARGRAKLRLALAQGKKLHDKRADEAKRDWQRQKARLMRDKG